MKKILLKAKDGSVAIMSLVDAEASPADIEDAVAKFRDSHPNENFSEYFEFKGELPLSREFRDAWTHDGKKVVIDSAKASSIHMKHVRHARDVALEQLDKEHLRHLSNPDKVKEIEEKKQKLRDLPVKVKGLEWPSDLPR